MPVIQFIAYSFALWLGAYLLARDGRKAGLRYAGIGLIFYAAGLAAMLLTPPELEATRWHFAIVLMPSLFWFGASAELLTPESFIGQRFILIEAVVSAAVILLIPAVAPLLPFVVALGNVWLLWRVLRTGLPQRPLVTLFTAGLFFALGVGLLALPLRWLPPDVIVLAVGGDLLILGYALAALDAYEEGESLLPDALRSLAAAGLAAVLFGGQIALINAILQRPPATALILAVVSTAILWQTLAAPIQALLDKLTFAPTIQQERAQFRAAAEARPRLNESLDLTTLDEKEFTRLTRRALSSMGNLNRLASSPLTRLPIIEARLNGHSANTLDRAQQLKLILMESIARLKPPLGEYGTTDEWRYYNALYYPYVAGLKPFSRRAIHDDLDDETTAILDWFQTYVPERTLHNWQNAAAKLIAQDLRELAL